MAGLTISPNQAQLLPLNTAYNRPFYVGVTGLTLTVTISKAAAAFGAIAGAVTEISSGWYKLALAAGDVDTEGALAYHATDGGSNIVDWSDEVAAPVKLADKVAHGGTLGSSTATLALAAVNVTNQADTAVVISGPGGNGIDISSSGGYGLNISAGADGVHISSGGYGLGISSGSNSINLSASAGYGINVVSSLDAVSLSSSTGYGFNVGSGAVSAVNIVGATTGLNITGAGVNAAVQIGDGNLGTEGIKIQAGGSNNDAAAILALGAGNRPAVQLGDGSNGAEGLKILGGTTSNGLDIAAGASGGYGVHIASPASEGVFVDSSDHAVDLNSGSGDGVHITPNQRGVYISSGANGIEVSAGDVGFHIASANEGLLVDSDIHANLVGTTRDFITALTESYAADGAAPTPAQALFGILSFLLERSISGTTVTCKKLDGTTTSMTLTINSSTTPTSQTRSS